MMIAALLSAWVTQFIVKYKEMIINNSQSDLRKDWYSISSDQKFSDTAPDYRKQRRPHKLCLCAYKYLLQTYVLQT